MFAVLGLEAFGSWFQGGRDGEVGGMRGCGGVRIGVVRRGLPHPWLGDLSLNRYSQFRALSDEKGY